MSENKVFGWFVSIHFSCLVIDLLSVRIIGLINFEGNFSLEVMTGSNDWMFPFGGEVIFFTTMNGNGYIIHYSSKLLTGDPGEPYTSILDPFVWRVLLYRVGSIKKFRNPRKEMYHSSLKTVDFVETQIQSLLVHLFTLFAVNKFYFSDYWRRYN